jgi:peptidoglycan/xylan/chitin deacetylase (PgdA/CDA1 family)
VACWFLAWAPSLALVACGDDEARPATADSTIPTTLEVNIQITGGTNLRPMVEELERRDHRATVWLTAAEIEADCEYVRSLSARGHEIAGVYREEITADLSIENQRATVAALAAAASRCSTTRISGFRAKRFTANEHTYAVMDEQGLRYLERSARSEPYSMYTFQPYAFSGHSFAILPMPILVWRGEVSSLCDTASEDMMTAAELADYEKVAIDFHRRTGEPIILEWHVDTCFPNDPGGYFETYKRVLDHLDSKGAGVRFVTALALVDRYAPKGGGCDLC